MDSTTPTNTRPHPTLLSCRRMDEADSSTKHEKTIPAARSDNAFCVEEVLGFGPEAPVCVSMTQDYNECSDLQASGGSILKEELVRWVPKVLKKIGTIDTFVLAEYGCSNGGNSVGPISEVHSAARMPVSVILNDRPENNWDVLENTLEQHFSTITANGNLSVSYAKHSMFTQQVAPKGTVHVAYTNYACHWLSNYPSKLITRMWGNQLDGHDEHRQMWAAHSKRDLEDFLHFRALEIAPGGVLMLGVWASDDGQFIMNSYDVMSNVKEQMLTSGRISRAQANELVIPEYARTISESFEVLNDARNRKTWTVRKCSTNFLDCPYVQELRSLEITAEECARKQTMSSKVVYDSFIVKALGNELADEFWKNVEDMSLDATGERASTAHWYNILVMQRN